MINNGSNVEFLNKKIFEFEDLLSGAHDGHIYKFVLEAIEKPLIEDILRKTNGNQMKAAKILGINRNTMRSKIKKLGIDARKWKIL